MSRPLAALALGLSLGAAGCTLGHGTAKEPAVDAVVLRGVRSVDGDELRAKLATHGPLSRPGALGFVLRERLRLDPDALAVDKRRIEAFYRERGYYRARVEDVEVREAGRGLVKVVFHVSEGEPVRITTVEVKGLEAAPDAARYATKLPVRPGDVFTEGAYDAARAQLLASLLSNGWAAAEVRQGAVVLPEAGTAEVTYDVSPGQRYRFGPIFVAGTAAVPRDLVRDQASAAVKTGAWWDESKLAGAQARVFDLGVFGGVRVTRGTPDPRRGTIPVVVAVREAPFRTLRFGPGLGFQATRWEAHGMVGWEHRNFFGDLRRVSADLRAGYAWVPTPWSTVKEGPVALLTGEFQQPAAFTRWVDATARVELEKGLLEAYDFYAERLRLGLPLRLAPRWSVIPSWNLEVYQLSNYALDFVPGATQTEVGPTLENCVGSVCLLSYLEQRLAWDGRDDPVNTRRGFHVSLAVQEGFHVGAYGYQYLRLLPELRAFHPLGARTVVAFRARFGALVPLGEAGAPPLVARFMAGGPISMRGYYTQRLGVLARQRGEWVAVGGNGLADGSVELRFGLGRTVGAVVFLDAGAVSNASSSPTEYQTALDPTRLQYAAGAGLRYHTPFGPLRLDVAARLPDNFRGDFDTWFPPVPYAYAEDGRLVRQPHREPIVAVHLAIGEAF
jgi:translocation and assembly module TamA